MASCGEIRIIWKTNDKWRDTDYFVNRKLIKPKNIATNDDWETVPIKTGDSVKVKYGSRWYNAQVAEIKEDETEEMVQIDHYEKFISQQAQRELEWKQTREDARKANVQKAAKLDGNRQPVETTSSVLPVKPSTTGSESDVSKQLRIKSSECDMLKIQLNTLEEKYEYAVRFAQVNSTFDGGDQTFETPQNSSENSTLGTIDIEYLKCLLDNPGHQIDNPMEPSTLHSSLHSSSSTNGNDNLRALSEELIKKFVTPSKDPKKISVAIEKQQEPHKCALKLLPFFFKNEELQDSNTDGTHGKRALDPIKLNSLKALLFNRFVLPEDEQEKVWKAVKSRINTKCRAAKFYKK